jgi:hypothetical protein
MAKFPAAYCARAETVRLFQETFKGDSPLDVTCIRGMHNAGKTRATPEQNTLTGDKALTPHTRFCDELILEDHLQGSLKGEVMEKMKRQGFLKAH